MLAVVFRSQGTVGPTPALSLLPFLLLFYLPIPASNSPVPYFLLCFHLLFHTSHSYSSAPPSCLPLPIPASLSSCLLLFPSSFHFRLNSSLYSVLYILLLITQSCLSIFQLLLFFILSSYPAPPPLLPFTLPTSHFCSPLTSFFTSTNPFQVHVLATSALFSSFHLHTTCIAPVVCSFLSTTAQLHATHRKGGDRRKRHSSSTRE